MIHRHGKEIAFNRSMVKKQISRKKAIKMLDTAVSLYIRARDGYKCYCGQITGEPMQCCHLISRSNYSTRWDDGDGLFPGNVFSGHRACNMEHEYHPEKMTSWYIGKFGAKNYEALVMKSRMPVKFSTSDILTMVELYRRKLEDLQKREGGAI